MQENQYISLLTKACSGEITPQEAEQLRIWETQSPEHAALARQVRAAWEASADWRPSVQVDLDVDFAQLQAKIRQSDTEMQPLRRVSMAAYLLRAAAVLLVLVAGVWGWNQWSSSSNFDTLATAAHAPKQLIQLPDGTQVWLRQGATLQYDHDLNTQKVRRVALTGEAYFDVAHNPAQPFRVELAQGGKIEVLGTQFDVKAESNAAERSVLVQSGKVLFIPVSNNKGAILVKGQQATYNYNNSELSLQQPQSFNALAWQTGGLTFVETPLEQVVADIEKYYDVKVTLQNADILKHCRYTAPMTNQPVETVLQTLTVPYGMKLKQIGEKSFELIGGSCTE